MLADWTNALPEGEPVVVAGDFNDWRQRANHPLKVKAGLEEIFTRSRGRPARTFPVRFPLLRLDRIYVKMPTPAARLRWLYSTGDISPTMPHSARRSTYEMHMAGR